MPFGVIYDANALYGNAQRDLLIRIARSGVVQAKWTETILDEITRNLSAKRPDIPPERLVRLRELMNSAVADCLVTDYEPLIESLELRDPDDRHALAAAITSGARWIKAASRMMAIFPQPRGYVSSASELHREIHGFWRRSSQSRGVAQ